MHARFFAGVMGLDDVRMDELADRFHLAAEPGHRLGVMHPLARQQLDRHHPFEHRMRRLEHRPHPALPDLFEQFVFANPRRRGRCSPRARIGPARR
jgi:hypothetical protein